MSSTACFNLGNSGHRESAYILHGMTHAEAVSNKQNPTARHLLLNLLLAAEHEMISAAEAVQACALFGISGNAARVALARLVRADLLESSERSEYRLGSKGRALGFDVATWRQARGCTRARLFRAFPALVLSKF